MNQLKFEHNRDRGKELQLACGQCNAVTYHQIEYSIFVTESSRDITAWTDYQMVSCRGCRTVSFRTCSRNSEEDYFDPETHDVELVETEFLYPSRIAGQAPLGDAYFLPGRLSRIYTETHQALSSNSPILAGIGLRAIVETICNDRSAKGKDLAEKINDLVTQGVLTAEGARLLHALRVLGNEAAHEVKPHKTEDLTTALVVVEHTLQGVYIIPKKAAALTGPISPVKAVDAGND
jgi:hypothetical protein